MSAPRERLDRLGQDGRQQPSPGAAEPVSARRWARYIRPLVRLAFRPSIEGMHHLPGDGPYLMVANHSGLGLPDIAVVVAEFIGRTDVRSPALMVHPVSFNSWPAGKWMLHLGAIPSTYEAANQALSAGVPVMVFPGGDIDATRPVWRANRVEFGGRKGFLRIARDAGVPIVPVGIHGTHYAAPVLFRSALLSTLLVFPRMNGVHKFPVSALGVLGGAGILALTWHLGPWLAWALALSWFVLPISRVPWIPWKVHLRIGHPVSPAKLFTDTSENTLQPAYDQIHEIVEDLVQMRPSDPPRFRNSRRRRRSNSRQ